MTTRETFGVLLVVLFSLLRVDHVEGFQVISHSIGGETLYEPPRVDLTVNYSSLDLYVRLCQYIVQNDTFLLVNMTRYCYCTKENAVYNCSYPGPTLVMYSNTSITIKLINELTGSSTIYFPNSSNWNTYKDMDTTNLHVHGLHVSPTEDDILLHIKPGESHEYNYHFGFHYPGTFWYHAHHHGSTTWQVNQGLHGAILMDNGNNTYKDNITENYIDNVLMFNWQYIINQSACLNNTAITSSNNKICKTTDSNGDEYDPDRFAIYPPWIDVDYNKSLSQFKYFLQFREYLENIFGTSVDNLTDIYDELSEWNDVVYYDTELARYYAEFETLSDLYGYIWLTQQDWGSAALGLGGPTTDYSMCSIYCDFPLNQRILSEYTYNVQSDIYVNTAALNITYNVDWHAVRWFVNGQIVPVIDDMQINRYRRLRFINSLSNFYLQMKFPSDNCEWHLIATDGIFINSDTYRNYNLANNSHQNMYIVAPGGRADMLVKCNVAGTYYINATNDYSTDGQLQYFPRVFDGTQLFAIKVLSSGGRVNPNGKDSTLPTQYDYFHKPNNTYIQDLSIFSESSMTQSCPCNSELLTVLPTSAPTKAPLRDIFGEQCTFQFGFPPNVDGVQFYYDYPGGEYPYLSNALTAIEKNQKYLFEINNDMAGNTSAKVPHVFHVHTSPFQVAEAIGNNGFIALPKTWWDTLGNEPAGIKSNYIPARFWTRDYDGLIIVHCHLLQHEDTGMMGFFNILNDSYTGITQWSQCPNYALSTDEEEDEDDVDDDYSSDLESIQTTVDNLGSTIWAVLGLVIASFVVLVACFVASQFYFKQMFRVQHDQAMTVEMQGTQ